MQNNFTTSRGKPLKRLYREPGYHTDAEGRRVCSKCKQFYPLDQFDKRSEARDGFFSWCKECRHLRYKEKRKALWKAQEAVKIKTCPRCKESKSITEFAFTGFRRRNVCIPCAAPKPKPLKPTTKTCKDCGSVRSVDAIWFGLLCPGCLNGRHRDYYKQNSESAWVRSSKRRAKIAELSQSDDSYTIEYILELFGKQKGRCANLACRKRLRKSGGVGKKFHIDHVIPVSRDGTNAKDNIQLLCPRCNLSKGYKLPDVWAAQNGLLFA